RRSRRPFRSGAAARVSSPLRRGDSRNTRAGSVRPRFRTGPLETPFALPSDWASLLHWRGLEDARDARRPHDAGEAEPRPREELRVLLARALAAREVHEHLDVQELAEVVLAGRRDHELDEEHRPARLHLRADVLQDGERLLVRPVVDDVLEEVGVRAGGG